MMAYMLLQRWRAPVSIELHPSGKVAVADGELHGWWAIEGVANNLSVCFQEGSKAQTLLFEEVQGTAVMTSRGKKGLLSGPNYPTTRNPPRCTASANRAVEEVCVRLACPWSRAYRVSPWVQSSRASIGFCWSRRISTWRLADERRFADDRGDFSLERQCRPREKRRIYPCERDRCLAESEWRP